MKSVVRISQLAERKYTGEFVQAIGYSVGERRYVLECFDPLVKDGKTTFNISTVVRGKRVSFEVPEQMTVAVV